MRPLTEPETQTLFEKLAGYTGSSLKNLIMPLDDSPNADRYVFRLSNSRVYYVRLSIANLATSVPRDKLLSLGICLGMPSLSLSPPSPSFINQTSISADELTGSIYDYVLMLTLHAYTQAASPIQTNSVSTSPLSPSSPNTPGTKSGSSRTGKCPSCTEGMS